MRRVDTIFDIDRLPPLFSETFKEIGPEWQKLSGINFEGIGRILVCHLIVEHYLTKYIELQAPKEFDWKGARLSFSQKIKLASKTDGLLKTDLIIGIEVLNKIRNKYAHNVQARLDPEHIKILKMTTVKISERIGFENPNVFEKTDYSDLAVIELFTSLVCASIAGFCHVLVTK